MSTVSCAGAMQQSVMEVQGMPTISERQSGHRAPEEGMRLPALRGIAPHAPPPPSREVAAAAAQLLSVDLEQPPSQAGGRRGESIT